MTPESYPVAALYPPEMQRVLAENHFSFALLSPEMRSQLLSDLQALVRLEYQVLAAQQAISQIDLYTAAIVTNTLEAAELMKLMHGGSPELEEYDRLRREAYLQTMHELVTYAHLQILDHMKGR